jgi:tetratricopeptide (TPR) repeat protein
VGRRSDALPVRAKVYVNEGLAGALEVYARNRANLEHTDVTVDLVPVGGGTAVRSVKADMLDIRAVGTGAGRTAQVVIPLDGVSPGDYVVRATLRAGNETVIAVVRQAEVAPGSAPGEAPAVQERVTPEMILGGDLARRFVASLGGSATDPTVKAAAAHASAGMWAKVLAALGEPAAQQPATFHILRGLALFALERHSLASTELESALSIEPASAPTAFFLGWVYANSARDTQAITSWRNAILIDPLMVPAYLAAADRYVLLGHPELARQVVNDGIRLVPTSAELKNKLAEVNTR